MKIRSNSGDSNRLATSSSVNCLKYNCHGLEHLGAELVFIQDRLGNYHSFYWRPTLTQLTQSQISPETPPALLIPRPREAYQKKIARVLERCVPERYHCILQYHQQIFPFELVISPILPARGEPELVLVMGRPLGEEEISLIANSASPANTDSLETILTQIARKIHLSPDPYHKLLTQIARQIRRTLDLETIWQQTVASLGEDLKVSRCLLLASAAHEEQALDVKAEYCQFPYRSMLGMRFQVEEESYLKQAMSCSEPLALEQLAEDEFERKSILVVSTFYQQQFNGMICLQQCDRHRDWIPAEIELIQELADQIGTAIAHATIYKQLEQANLEAEEASRLKSEFLASTSHELRTPLNGIIGFLKLILDGMADDVEEQQEFLEQAYNSALHLLNLINDILDIAKIEAGKIEFNFIPIDLKEICQDVYKFTSNQAEKKHLDLQINLPATYDQILVYADYQRLLQIMLNLVGNALKFTHQGTIEIKAEIVPKKNSLNSLDLPGMVKISVADTGIGVSLDKQEKLFSKFYQVDGSRTKAYGGTGLGLAISKRLIEAMGGKISFYSMGEGLGSTVTFTIPLSQLPVLKTNRTLPKRGS
jgi:signal transduction histidine kinase